MTWTIEDVRQSFNGRLMGNLNMRRWVCETLLRLPSEIIDHVTKNVWFISSPEDAWAFTFRGSDIHGQHLIILSDELFEQEADHFAKKYLNEL